MNDSTVYCQSHRADRSQILRREFGKTVGSSRPKNETPTIKVSVLLFVIITCFEEFVQSVPLQVKKPARFCRRLK